MEFPSYRDAIGYTFSDKIWHFGVKNGTKNIEEALFHYNPAELGIVTGILTTVCIFNFNVAVLKEDLFKGPVHLDHSRPKAMFQFVLNLVFFLILFPIISTSLIILYAYKALITLLLKIQLQEKFAGFLEGTDCVWTVENASCKSVINVLGILEAESDMNCSDFLLKLRNLVQKKLIGQANSNLWKLSCLRKKRYGYFFWEKCDSVNIEEHVRWLETLDGKDIGEEELDEGYLNRMMSEVCAKPLPQKDQASWEILVSRNHLRRNVHRVKEMEEGLILPRNYGIKVPIIFRLHHTLGDGFALFKLLMSTIADSRDVEVTLEDEQKEIIPPESSRGGAKTKDFQGVRHPGLNAELMLRTNKNLLGASMPFSLVISFNLKESLEKYLISKFGKFVSFHEVADAVFKFSLVKIRETMNVVSSELRRIFRMIFIFIEMPSCLVHQWLRSMDNSALHGPKLSGEKIVSFWIESESGVVIGDRNLLMKIRRIKNATGTKFGDVILAALSASLQKYFEQIGEFPPKSVTVVLPARISVSEKNSPLDNGFSVGLLPLPICRSVESQQAKNFVASKRDMLIVERLFEVARNSYKLRGDSDYWINFLVMNWLSAVLPEALLRLVLDSHSTLIFSNIPGPREVKIGGHRLGKLVFWVPHKGSTGIGFTVLSYGGKMHFGLIADKAVIQNEKLLGRILENTVQEIDNLHEMIFVSNFSKYLNSLNAASTNTESESCKKKLQS